jgi:hypothetical protein
LKNAFTQAMNELGNSGTPPAGTIPATGDNATAGRPDGQPPAGTVGGMPNELMAKVASILGIDQQTLQNAFTPRATDTPVAPERTP